MKDISSHLIEVLEAIREDLSEMKSVLAVNTKELEIHIKRTGMLETRLEAHEKDLNKMAGFFSYFGYAVAAVATFITIWDRIHK